VGGAKIAGGGRCLGLHSGTLIIDTLIASGFTTNAVLIGQGGNLKAGLIDIQSGSVTVTQDGILYSTSFGGSGGLGAIDIGTVRYRHNSVANDLNIVVRDETNGPFDWRVGHIDGTGALEQARFGGSGGGCFIRHGKVYFATMPTVGPYDAGDMVWSNAPAITTGRTLMGWMRLTTGTGHVAGTDWTPVYAPVATA
jgi:hypothetical protein